MPVEPEWADALWLKLALLPVVGATLLTAIGLGLGLRIDRRWAWGIGVGAVAVFAATIIYRAVAGLLPLPDFTIFWLYGRLVLDGRDPYAMAELYFNPFLYPPNTLPFLALSATVPRHVSGLIFSLANVPIVLALVPLSRRILVREDDSLGPAIPPHATAVLMGAVAFSTASVGSFEEGQLSILAAAMLLLAIDARGRGRPILAGLCLTVAAMKAATTLPFLLLFHRRRDLPTWVALSAGTLALCLMTGPPSSIPRRILALPPLIAKYGAEGKVNDYSLASSGSHSEAIVGLDQMAHRLGLRDRRVIASVQWAGLGVIGAGLAWGIIRRRLSDGAACSLVALYSVIFLYHRFYDLVILALPLVYCFGRARTASGRARWIYAVSAGAILVALYPSGRMLVKVLNLTREWGTPGTLIRAIYLPSVTLAILAAMAGIVWAGRGVTAKLDHADHD